MVYWDTDDLSSKRFNPLIKDKYTSVTINSDFLEDHIKWCNEQCTGRYYITKQNEITFEKKEDAVQFKLIFC